MNVLDGPEATRAAAIEGLELALADVRAGRVTAVAFALLGQGEPPERLTWFAYDDANQDTGRHLLREIAKLWLEVNGEEQRKPIEASA